MEYWGSKLSSTSRADQKGALGMLGGYMHQAVPYIPAIGRYLESGDDSLGFAAAWTLAHIGAESHPTLVKALKHPQPTVRRRAAYGLGEAGSSAIGAVPELNQLANGDPVTEVRYMAQWAVDQIANPRLIADPNLFLMTGLTSSDLNVRLAAIRRLGVSHPSNVEAVTRLVTLLGDSLEVIRYSAIEALVQKGQAALPALTTALNSRGRLIRQGAMLAIARIQPTF